MNSATLPTLGHNGGPPLDPPDPNESWHLWCWKRAHKKAWSVPREIALRRLERAEALGMTYRAYTLEVLERGRHPDRPATESGNATENYVIF